MFQLSGFYYKGTPTQGLCLEPFPAIVFSGQEGLEDPEGLWESFAGLALIGLLGLKMYGLGVTGIGV